MKLPIIAAVLLAGAALNQAQVPGLINYQGRLTTPSGAPASGTKNFSLSIYDAETGGNLLYTEAVGPVTLDSAGVYSFQFGTAGTSSTQVTETLATTDGAAASFQKILANTGVIAGTLSVTDGTYTWSQSAGSSSEDDFGVAYSSSLRRVTVSYFSAPPAAGKSISATYRYATSGISGAINAGSQHWMAISVDGVAQAARQRVLAVPFAMQAGFAAMAGDVVEKTKVWRPDLYDGSLKYGNDPNATVYSKFIVQLPISIPYKVFPPTGASFEIVSGSARIPTSIKKLNSLFVSSKLGKKFGASSSLSVWITRINPANPADQESVLSISESPRATQQDASYSAVSVSIEKPININLDHNYLYEINFRLYSYGSSGPFVSELADLKLSVTD
jgi:hypothetical protein